MEKVLDNLTHLVRDLFFYFIPGAIVIFLTREHSIIYNYQSFGMNFKFESGYILIFIAYVIGHIISVIANCFDKKMKDDIYLVNEIGAYRKWPKHHRLFIDRYNSLYYLRRNISVSFFLVSILNFVIGKVSCNCNINSEQYYSSIFIFLLIGLIMCFGAVDARKKFFIRINNINNLPPFKDITID